MGRLWLLGWQWAMPRADIPPGCRPTSDVDAAAARVGRRRWDADAASDQWQLAAICFAALTGEEPPRETCRRCSCCGRTCHAVGRAR